MKKSKAVLLSIEALVLAAVLTVGVSVLLPGDAGAEDPLCSPYGFRTVNAWGMGTTCPAARNNCAYNAWVAAWNYCGARDVCEAQAVVYHQADCYTDGGLEKIDCHMDFKCTLGF